MRNWIYGWIIHQKKKANHPVWCARMGPFRPDDTATTAPMQRETFSDTSNAFDLFIVARFVANKRRAISWNCWGREGECSGGPLCSHSTIRASSSSFDALLSSTNNVFVEAAYSEKNKKNFLHSPSPKQKKVHLFLSYTALNFSVFFVLHSI